ncbi:MAG TPA: hypothetical protein PK358_01275 [Spirochaetota bacterium]|nr:hypothetical protein [Spirochaetota bacterium]HPJ33432.1 hypothetical protein [Spirochaetota bacterium]
MKIKKAALDTFYFMKGFFSAFTDKSTRMVEFEVEEMENIFSLMIFGTFTGMPAPPPHITLQLMPLMHQELINMLDSVETASDPVGKLGNILDSH